MLLFCRLYGQEQLNSSQAEDSTEKKLHAIFSLPYINGFDFQTKDTARRNWGFVGISIGVDYGDDHSAWGLKIGGCTDVFAPIGPISREGVYDTHFGVFVNLSRKHFKSFTLRIRERKKIHKVEFGYGLSYVNYTWKLNNTAEDPSTIAKVSTASLGTASQLNYLLNHKFYIGFIYQPGILVLEESLPLRYQHLMSFDFGWSF